jgi:hypothetical protein
MQDSLVVGPFVAAAAEATTTPAKRLFVLLASRTAIDAAVSVAVTEGKPIDAGLVADVMNLLTSQDRLLELFRLRRTCKLTLRGSFPVPRYPLLELPTRVIEGLVGGSCSREVSFACICQALALHYSHA